jgi:hypothetical protein
MNTGKLTPFAELESAAKAPAKRSVFNVLSTPPRINVFSQKLGEHGEEHK